MLQGALMIRWLVVANTTLLSCESTACRKQTVCERRRSIRQHDSCLTSTSSTILSRASIRIESLPSRQKRNSIKKWMQLLAAALTSQPNHQWKRKRSAPRRIITVRRTTHNFKTIDQPLCRTRSLPSRHNTMVIHCCSPWQVSSKTTTRSSSLKCYNRWR